MILGRGRSSNPVVHVSTGCGGSVFQDEWPSVVLVPRGERKARILRALVIQRTDQGARFTLHQAQ